MANNQPTNKGTLLGECNRTACNKSPAIYFNHSTRKHYCSFCANIINQVNPEAYTIYGHVLCTRTEVTADQLSKT